MAADFDARYRKQTLFAPIGEEGQALLHKGRALVVGCGALGSIISETLVRAGVGLVRIVDRDFVELSNLQRQVLFDERDVAERIPKAVAASRKLAAINSGVQIEPVVADVRADNVLELVEGIDVIVDGTDNFETRLLVNDASLELGIPWVNGGCVGAHGQVMTILPGKTPCFRCLVEDVPEPGSSETCDTAGVIGPAVNIVASLECVDALKILVGKSAEIEQVLTVVDVWEGTFRRLKIGDLRTKGRCPACQKGERAWLRGERASQTAILCGRNAVQVSPAERRELDLAQTAERLKTHGDVQVNPYLIRVRLREPECELTLFRDGRAIVQGTEDAGLARSLYSRYVGA
ncbi:ThiF family adenylyltransferase [Caulifigura coniformis]|nr:ThiF family adenylyltransferase [Caulifigura coniformis]